MKEISILSAKVHVELDYFLTGSVKENSVENGVSQVRSIFEVESPEPKECVTEIIELAKKGCFAESLVTSAVPLNSKIILNGAEVHLN